jgi:hypothetical protein
MPGDPSYPARRAFRADPVQAWGWDRTGVERPFDTLAREHCLLRVFRDDESRNLIGESQGPKDGGIRREITLTAS